jgi:hypothetical protein
LNRQSQFSARPIRPPLDPPSEGETMLHAPSREAGRCESASC